MNSLRLVCLFVVGVLGWSERAQAQGRTFVIVDVGVETPHTREAVHELSRTLSTGVDINRHTYRAKRGVTPDVSAGYIFKWGLGAMVGINYFRGGERGAAFVQRNLFGTTVSNQRPTLLELVHAQTAVHVDGVYALPIGKRIEIMAFAGYSWVKLRQQMMTSVTFVQTFAPPFILNINSITAMELISAAGHGSNFGVNVGFFATRSRHLTFGATFRHVQGDVTLPDRLQLSTIVSDGIPYHAGGNILSAGVNFRIGGK